MTYTATINSSSEPLNSHAYYDINSHLGQYLIGFRGLENSVIDEGKLLSENGRYKVEFNITSENNDSLIEAFDEAVRCCDDFTKATVDVLKFDQLTIEYHITKSSINPELLGENGKLRFTHTFKR